MEKYARKCANSLAYSHSAMQHQSFIRAEVVYSVPVVR